MTNTTNNPVTIPIEKLKPFEGHPYKVQDNEEMNTLIESIQDNGILSPIIVRPLENTDDKYEVISGHRRLHAAVKAGIKEIPAFIYAVSRDEAAVMVVDSNLHREHILPSEKAFAYKMKMDALKHQGKRSDLTLPQDVSKLRSGDIVGEALNESRETVRRYIRLTKLIPELLEMMDKNEVAFSVGVELSYLDDQSQYDVLEQCEQNECTPSYSQSVRMHRAANDGTLNRYLIEKIMSEEKANQRDTIKIPSARLKHRIPSTYTAQQTEDYIVRAVEHYAKYLQKQRENSR